MTKLMRYLLPALAAAAVVAVAPTAAGAGGHHQTTHYKGKTHEGTKISFVVKNGWVDQFHTLLPTTCVSPSGGTRVDFTDWSIPYKYRLGRTGKVTYGDPTKHYKIKTHGKAHKRVAGELSINYSLLGTDGAGGYKIWHCLATARFSLKPKR